MSEEQNTPKAPEGATHPRPRAMSAYAPGAPEQVWAIPDDVLDDGAKLTLMRLWSKADHEIQQAPKPTDVWAPAREGMTPTEALHADLAEGRGCSVRKIRRHLTKLRALGLAVATGRLVHLVPPVSDSDAGECWRWSLENEREGELDPQVDAAYGFFVGDADGAKLRAERIAEILMGLMEAGS